MIGFICNATSTWPDGKLPTDFWQLNHELSGGNPNSIMEVSSAALRVQQGLLTEER